MKRFTDTAIWQDEWFMNLPPDYKLAFMFIKDNCDNAGVWKPNKKLAEMMIGCPVQWDDFLNECGDRIKIIQSGYWWITRFCEFQYGTLSEACKPHIKVIETLKKYNLSIGYTKGIQTLEEKEEEKEKDKEEEKEKKPKKLKKSDHLFSESKFFDFNLFEKEFEGTEYEKCDLRIYYQKVRDWSASGGKKKIDWIATARNFMLTDKEKGKQILKKFIPGRTQKPQEPTKEEKKETYESVMVNLLEEFYDLFLKGETPRDPTGGLTKFLEEKGKMNGSLQGVFEKIKEQGLTVKKYLDG
jgi:hypothetical protein